MIKFSDMLKKTPTKDEKMKKTLIIKAPDDIPFKEAFRFARNKGGSDALFDWKGKRYTTLFEEESTHSKDEKMKKNFYLRYHPNFVTQSAWDEEYKKYKDKKNKGEK